MNRSVQDKCRRASSCERSRLFHAACQQDGDALQQLLLWYRPLLQRLAKQRIQGRLRVKVAPSDIVQATIWRATQSFHSQDFDKRKGFRNWLTAIVKNVALDAHRRFCVAKRRDISRERPLHSTDAQSWLHHLSIGVSAEGSKFLERQETMEAVLVALGELPSHYQLVLRLRYYEMLEFNAIGEILERSSDAVRILHNRALARLSKSLGAYRSSIEC